MMHHRPEELAAYVDGSSPNAGAIELHAAACPECTERIAALRDVVRTLCPKEFWTRPLDVNGVLDFADLLHAEDVVAEQHCNDMLDHPASWRLQYVRKTVGTRAAGIVRHLLERWRTVLEAAPSVALEMTDLTLRLADALDPERYPPEIITLLRGQAHRCHSVVLAFMGNYSDGLDHAERAHRLFELVPGSAYDLARTALVKAVSLQHSERAEEAARDLAAAAETFLEYGDRRWYVNARITEGAVLYNMSALERALNIWRSVEHEPILNKLEQVRVTHNIALTLVDLGRAGEAIELSRRCVEDFELLGHATERTRSRMVFGRALLATGRPYLAIAALRQTRREFIELELFVDAATTSLELAECLMLTNRPHEVADLCREALALCTKAGMRKAAATALAYLREAVVAGQATPVHVRDARVSLRRHCAGRPRVFISSPRDCDDAT